MTFLFDVGGRANKLLFLIMVSLFVTQHVRAQCDLNPGVSVKDLVKCLEGDDTSVRQKAIFAIHRRGKDAIPDLIANVSNRKKVVAILSDPRSSGRHVIEPTVGVVSAYIIESILGIEILVEKTTRHIGFTMGEGSHNYVFRDGFIVNSENKIISDGELDEIQGIYRQWWGKNQNETICVLREKWKKGERILDGNGYRWQ